MRSARKNHTMDVLWHDIIDVDDIDRHDGPDADTLGTQTVVTVICGEVSGELDRHVSRDDDGGLVVAYEARIDGLGECTGVAKIESGSADELRCLAGVADFLARQMATLVADALAE
jgi:hypothetical protein